MKALRFEQMENLNDGDACTWSPVGALASGWGAIITAATVSGPVGWAALV